MYIVSVFRLFVVYVHIMFKEAAMTPTEMEHTHMRAVHMSGAPKTGVVHSTAESPVEKRVYQVLKERIPLPCIQHVNAQASISMRDFVETRLICCAVAPATL